ncbi:hypothetical protein FALBO_6944 [Fusarium albosuccineum]|uniref:Uncharacterized protein n=1 Tax=Fusarium albosuccineum TaxID=1237068 RepID=A0A8H4LB58_9HYPO|nr:hypothetical protein FALBO_6944 [Fusarium albosuccineum]
MFSSTSFVTSQPQPPPPPLPTTETWIVSTSIDKPDPRTRRIIRSKAMRGRNTRADRQAWARARSQRDEALFCQRADAHAQQPALPIPRKIASELALDRYGFEMKPYMLDLMYQGFNTVKPCTYAVDMKLINESETELYALNDIHRHRATIHSILFASQAFQDLSRGQPFGDIAQFHLGKTLHYLQQSLNDQNGAISMATIAVVTTLASAASMFGDLETVEKHMNGLHQIFELRGGMQSLQRGSLIQHKAQRLDLSLSMSTGQKPRLFPDEISWSPQITRAGFATRYKELDLIQPAPDPRLIGIWADLKHYSTMANKAWESGGKISPEFFLLFSTSIPIRLLDLEYEISSISELMRLAMLANVKGVLFRIPGVGRRMRYLFNRLEQALQAQQYPPLPENARLIFWALIVSGISIFEDFDQVWLRSTLVQTALVLGVQGWSKARAILRSVAWIDVIYDGPAETAFDQWHPGARYES